MLKDLKFIGMNIRALRRSRNWTLAQLASKRWNRRTRDKTDSCHSRGAKTCENL